MENNTNNSDNQDAIEVNVTQPLQPKEEPIAKSAKDLFSDFKASDESDFEPNDLEAITDTDSDEPLSKKLKKKKELKRKSKASNNDDSPKKKVNFYFIILLGVVLLVIQHYLYVNFFQKNYIQKYKKEWEAIPAVKPWISESVHGPHYFYCRFCKKDYKCGKTEIFKHMSAMKHKKHLTNTTQSVQVVTFN